MAYRTVEELYRAILNRLAPPGYADTYADESAFEADVWSRLVELLGPDATQHCLTSHTQLQGRSAAAWEAFCRETRGPDVNVLGSNNRLDIVVRNDTASIGIEVKWLGKGGDHAGKLTQGLGQVMLALENRDRTLLMIHCGGADDIDEDDRRRLQRVANNICLDTKTAIIVVP